ncbi:hypothetical protein ACEWY4_022060 [Coilia grayii]|uniref:Globin domain-containing protein n=1 Tax=Coilia grayii TaxID=363190 RepID=A0ABD1J525_9TELE
MAEFKPDGFMGEEVTRTRLVRLTKPQLVQLVDFMEFQRDEDTTKAKLIDCLALQLGLADDQTKALREEQKAARERELEEQRARQKEKEKELELQIVTAEDKKKDERPPSDHTASEPQSPVEKTPSPVSEKPVLQETWVPLENFTQCFQTLLVFHKPSAYTHHSQKSQYKSSIFPRLSATDLTSPNSQSPEEKGSYFMVVDSLQPSEVLISFSALLHWGESLEEKKELALRSGVLTVEPVSWRSLQCQMPIFCSHTSACKASLLKLQPGQTPFVFGDEESVMPVLTKESVCFEQQAVCVARALGELVSCFSSEADRQAATRALTHTHFPPSAPRNAAGQHMKVFSEAVHRMFSGALGRELSSQELLAVQALTLQPSSGAGAHTSSHSPSDAPSPEQAEVPGVWAGRGPPTEAENRAATTLQAGLRGYTARRVIKAARPGTKENMSAAKTLKGMWASVEADLKKHAIALLGYMFSENPQCVDLYSCKQDEESRISLSEHSVALPDTPNTWALIYREVFVVPKDTLLLAKVYSPVPSVLHVIDNDTGEEVPRVFRRVQPHIYRKNQHGYTFVAETHTGDAPSGRWRMCLIGCRQPLPVPVRDTPLNSFCVKEFKDYYIPNDKHIICRFSVSVSVEVLGTVQFQVSVPQVLLRLTVLDHHTPLASATGRGQVLIPVFTFRADTGTHLHTSSAGLPAGSGERPGREEAVEEEEQEPMDTLPDAPPAPTHTHTHTHTHKYMVQAEVLHRSWPISEPEAAFIHSLRLAERNEIRVGGDKPDDISVDQSPSSDGQKSSTPKTNRKAKEKEKEKDKPVPKPASRLEQDESIAERQRVARWERIQEFRLQRDMVLQRRQQEAALRRALKRRQLEQYDAIQVSVCEWRRPVLEAREAVRGRQQAQQRLEEEAACEAAQRQAQAQEQDRSQAQPNRKSAGKKK